MKKFLYSCGLIFCFLLLPGGAYATTGGSFHEARKNLPLIILAAGNCGAKANALAASYSNAKILSVTDNGNSCTIVLRVKESGSGHSRIIRKTVSG